MAGWIIAAVLYVEGGALLAGLVANTKRRLRWYALAVWPFVMPYAVILQVASPRKEQPR